MGCLATHDRDGTDGEAGVVVELVEAYEHQVGEVGRQASCAPFGGGDELLDEERVPLAALQQLAHIGLGKWSRVERRDQHPHLLLVERPQLKAGDGRKASPFGERRPEWVSAVEVVTSVGGKDDDGRGEPSGEQKGEQLPCRLVGPVDVFHHEEQRGVTTELGERPEDGVEQDGRGGPLLGIYCCCEQAVSRQQPGDRRARLDEGLGETDLFCSETAEGVAERQVREGDVTEVEALPDEHPPARLLCPHRQLGDEAALSDAGIATEDEVAARLVVEADERGDPPDLLTAPDEGYKGYLGHVHNHRGPATI